MPPLAVVQQRKIVSQAGEQKKTARVLHQRKRRSNGEKILWSVCYICAEYRDLMRERASSCPPIVAQSISDVMHSGDDVCCRWCPALFFSSSLRLFIAATFDRDFFPPAFFLPVAKPLVLGFMRC